jgi:hypothetical protein
MRGHPPATDVPRGRTYRTAYPRGPAPRVHLLPTPPAGFDPIRADPNELRRFGLLPHNHPLARRRACLSRSVRQRLVPAPGPIHNPTGYWSGVKVTLDPADQRDGNWINYITGQWTIPNIDNNQTYMEYTPFDLSTWIGFGSETAFISIGVDVLTTYEWAEGSVVSVNPWIEQWAPDSPGSVLFQFLAPELLEATFPETSISTSVGDLVKATISLDTGAPPFTVEGVTYVTYTLSLSNVTQDFSYSSVAWSMPLVEGAQAAWVVEPTGPSLSDVPVQDAATPLFPVYGQVFFDDVLCAFSAPHSLFGIGLLEPIANGTPGFVTDQHGNVLSKAHAQTNTCIQCWNPQNDQNEHVIFQVPQCLPETGPPIVPQFTANGRPVIVNGKQLFTRVCTTPNEFQGYNWRFVAE